MKKSRFGLETKGQMNKKFSKKVKPLCLTYFGGLRGAGVIGDSMASSLCCAVVSSSATHWTVAHQAPMSMEFFRQKYWSGCQFLLQGIFLTQGSNPGLPHCRQMLYRLSHQGSLDTVNFSVFTIFSSIWT